MRTNLFILLIVSLLENTSVFGQRQLNISFCEEYSNKNELKEVLLIIDSDTSKFTKEENNTFLHSLDFIDNRDSSSLANDFCILSVQDTKYRYQIAIRVNDIICGHTVVCIEKKVFKKCKVKSNYRTCRGSYVAGFSIKERL